MTLVYDEKGLYRSNTRVNPGKLKYFQEYPILLRSNSHFTRLVILQYHEDVHHCGLENTLTRKSMDWFLYDNGLRHERVK